MAPRTTHPQLHITLHSCHATTKNIHNYCPHAAPSPRTAREVGGVVLGGEDGRLDRRVVRPHARRPVADGQEELGVEGVAAQPVDGPVVAVEHVLDAVSRVLGLAVAREDGALRGGVKKGVQRGTCAVKPCVLYGLLQVGGGCDGCNLSTWQLGASRLHIAPCNASNLQPCHAGQTAAARAALLRNLHPRTVCPTTAHATHPTSATSGMHCMCRQYPPAAPCAHPLAAATASACAPAPCQP